MAKVTCKRPNTETNFKNLKRKIFVNFFIKRKIYVRFS